MALVDIAKETGDVDRTHGINQVLKHFKENKYTVNNVLDLFAGDGSFCSWLLYSLETKDGTLPNIDHLELDQELYEKLVDRFGRHRNNCYNVDSYKFIEDPSKLYDTVFCDNGMWDHEYFNVIPYLTDFFLGAKYFIHNINVRPYNGFKNNSVWGKNRSEFYGMKDTADCDPEDLMEATYQRLKENNLDVNYGVFFPRELYNGHIYLYHVLWKIN